MAAAEEVRRASQHSDARSSTVSDASMRRDAFSQPGAQPGGDSQLQGSDVRTSAVSDASARRGAFSQPGAKLGSDSQMSTGADLTAAGEVGRDGGSLMADADSLCVSQGAVRTSVASDAAACILQADGQPGCESLMSEGDVMAAPGGVGRASRQSTGGYLQAADASPA